MVNTIIAGLKERISSAIDINQSVGIIIPGNNYFDLIKALFEYMYEKPESAWIYVTITKPYDDILQQFTDLSSKGNIKFIDCVSRAAGMHESTFLLGNTPRIWILLSSKYIILGNPIIKTGTTQKQAAT